MLTCLGTGAVLTETERETDYIQHNNQLLLLNTSHILQSLKCGRKHRRSCKHQSVYRKQVCKQKVRVHRGTNKRASSFMSLVCHGNVSMTDL